eukprot:COSAG02_NODE_76_length_41115_cov_60.967817_24_plen_130_part_00
MHWIQISRSSPAFVLPTDLLELVAALFVERHQRGEGKAASLYRDAVQARCCAPVLPADGSETPFADATGAATGDRVASAAARGTRGAGQGGAGEELLAWVSAQEAGSGNSEDGDGDDCSVSSGGRGSYS